jgi:hypothetical protein
VRCRGAVRKLGSPSGGAGWPLGQTERAKLKGCLPTSSTAVPMVFAYPTKCNGGPPSAVKRHFRQQCWLPARLRGRSATLAVFLRHRTTSETFPVSRGRGTIAMIGGGFVCFGGDGGGGFCPHLSTLTRCHLQPTAWLCHPTGGRLALSVPSGYLRLAAWLCHPKGRGKSPSAPLRSSA